MQAALPNAANLAAATASCSLEATMATINTGIVGCLNVQRIEARGTKFGVVTISLHLRVSEKISDNLACTLKFDHVSTIASAINVKPQGCTAWGWREPAVHVGSRPNADITIFL